LLTHDGTRYKRALAGDSNTILFDKNITKRMENIINMES